MAAIATPGRRHRREIEPVAARRSRAARAAARDQRARPADDLLVDEDAAREAGPEPALLRRAPEPRDRHRHHRDGRRARDRLPAHPRHVGARVPRGAPAARRRARGRASGTRARRRGSRSVRCSSSRRRSPRSWWWSRSRATAISIATTSTPRGSAVGDRARRVRDGARVPAARPRHHARDPRVLVRGARGRRAAAGAHRRAAC